jgi:hypothetical protein
MRHPIQLPQLYWVASWNFTRLFLKYENEFQNPQIFQQTISLFAETIIPFAEHSTLAPPTYLHLTTPSSTRTCHSSRTATRACSLIIS